MVELVKDEIKKAIRANNAEFIGIQAGGIPRRVILFRYRGLDMAMYVDEVNRNSVKRHIENKLARLEDGPEVELIRFFAHFPNGLRTVLGTPPVALFRDMLKDGLCDSD